MKLEINSVVSIKLTSGEEFITRIKDEVSEHGFFIIGEPVSVAPSPNGQGLGLIPSMFTADPKGQYKLNVNNIVIIAPTDEKIKAKYQEVTTGILVPEKKIILQG
jgi:hypothetical protein